MKTNIIYNEDCLEGIKRLPDKSVNFVIADPPYNIGKADWDRIPDYINWSGKWVLECQRVLKNNGSFYWFHNDMPTISRLMIWLEENTNFIFKQFIVWDKYTKFRTMQAGGGPLCGILETNQLRNYHQFTEYLLFYTFQDETGLTTIMLDINNFVTLRKYFYELLCFIGENNKSIAQKLGHRKAEHCFYVIPKKQIIEKIGQRADHCFRYGSTQWDLPTKETYQELIDIFSINNWESFREYKDLRCEYGDLRQEYESLRYTFNNQKTDHTATVWHYSYAKKNGHLTPKPIPLIENILKHSSNEGDIVLIPFVGSGNECIACKRLNRKYIGFEINKKYCQIAKARLEAERTLWDI